MNRLLNPEDDLTPDNPWLTPGASQAPAIDMSTGSWGTQQATATPSTTTQPPAQPQAPAAAGTPASYATDLGPSPWTTGTQGAATAAQPGAGAQASVSTYQTHIDALNNATTPQDRLIAQDALTQQLQQDLEADGHKVTFKNGQIVVDGRAYEVGNGAQTTQADSSAVGLQGDEMNPGPGEPAPGTPEAPVPQAPPWGTGPNPSEPNRTFVPPKGATLNSSGYWVDANGALIKGQVTVGMAGFASAPPGWIFPTTVNPNDTPGGSGTSGDHVGFGKLWVASGGRTVTDLKAFIAAHPEYGAELFGTKGDKVKIGGRAFDAVMSAGNNGGQGAWWNDITDGGGGSGAAPPPPPAPGRGLNTDPWNMDVPLPPWLTGGMESMADATKPTATEQSLEQLVQQMLAHPESLSERDVETLKAKGAEDAASAARAQDEEIQHFGYGAQLQDSPWLASQRATNAWQGREATIKSNRDIDVAAMQKRQADRLAAGDLGQAYVKFQADKKRQAEELGISQKQVLTSYIKVQHDFFAQSMGFQIDAKKLEQQSLQFQQDLAFRYEQLKQQSDQFAAEFNLAMQKFQHQKDEDAWKKAHDDTSGN